MQHPQQGYGYAPAPTHIGVYTNGSSSNDNSMTAVNYVSQGYQQTLTPTSASSRGGKQRRRPAAMQALQPPPPPGQIGLTPYELYSPHIAPPAFGIAGYAPHQQAEMAGIAAGFAQPYYYPAPARGGRRSGAGGGSRGQGRPSQNMAFGGIMASSGGYSQGPIGAFCYAASYPFTGNNAVPEKTPTIYVKHPETGKVMGVKLNRVLDTLAPVAGQLEAQNLPKQTNTSSENKDGDEGVNVKPESTAAPEPLAALTTTTLRLCANFMSAQGCTNGSCCTDVHTAGMEYLWETITPKTVTTKNDASGAEISTYAPGFLVRCYDSSLTHYYEIPSESVVVNKGSEEYIRMFNFNGNNFKKKFKVTALGHSAFSDQVKESEDIYCTLESLESEADKLANTTHVNDPDRMANAERLPASMLVRVYDQNNYERFQDYPGSFVLVTEGAKSYAKMYAQCHNSIPVRKRMQHCAHFRLHNMCRMGSQCRFVHVLRTPEEIAAAKLKSLEKK